jgi:glutamate racemase
MTDNAPIGIFDSGYGGLTIFKEIQQKLPQYDYLYLGDNARVPYGIRSFETVYEFTKECVFKLFEEGCNLVILACNTASAKALRTIQQKDLPPGKKVLGIVRPTTEIIHEYTSSNNIGILATEGTVRSDTYKIEINKFHPHIEVFQQACPLWVPLVEHNEIHSAGAHYFVEQDLKALLAQSNKIDVLVLACTHYPLLTPVIESYLPKHIKLLSQGELVTDSLTLYLQRHPEVEEKCSKNGTTTFYTTSDAAKFETQGKVFFEREITAQQIKI